MVGHRNFFILINSHEHREYNINIYIAIRTLRLGENLDKSAKICDTFNFLIQNISKPMSKGGCEMSPGDSIVGCWEK